MIAVVLVGCSAGDPGEAPFAVQLATVVDAPTASAEPYHDPERAMNGVRGGGRWSGGVDVFEIGLEPDEGVVLAFDAPIPDGDGVELAVFENPFDVYGGGRFFDPVVVEVSADCDLWVPFPHAHAGEWSPDPAGWTGFAGITPVALHEEDNPVDPLGDDAGGDAFDLADLGDEAPAEIACVRLTSASAWLDATGIPYPHDPVADGPDIDGVYGRDPYGDMP